MNPDPQHPPAAPASTPPRAAVQRLVSHFILQTSSLILLFCFACAAQPAGRAPTLTPPATSASDNPTAGAARHLTQQAAATRSSRATTNSVTGTQKAVVTQTAQAGARLTQTAEAASTVAAQATGQAM